MNSQEVQRILCQNAIDVRYLVAEKIMGWSYQKSKHGNWIVTDPDGNRFWSEKSYYDRQSGERIEPNWWDATSVPEYEHSLGLEVL